MPSADPSPTSSLLGLALPETLSEEEVVALLRDHVAQLLVTQRDWLLGKLYRLDVRERDIQRVLAKADLDPALGLAQLILARHYEREAARRKHRPLEEGEDEELGDVSW